MRWTWSTRLFTRPCSRCTPCWSTPQGGRRHSGRGAGRHAFLSARICLRVFARACACVGDGRICCVASPALCLLKQAWQGVKVVSCPKHCVWRKREHLCNCSGGQGHGGLPSCNKWFCSGQMCHPMCGSRRCCWIFGLAFQGASRGATNFRVGKCKQDVTVSFQHPTSRL